MPIAEVLLKGEEPSPPGMSYQQYYMAEENGRGVPEDQKENEKNAIQQREVVNH